MLIVFFWGKAALDKSACISMGKVFQDIAGGLNTVFGMVMEDGTGQKSVIRGRLRVKVKPHIRVSPYDPHSPLAFGASKKIALIDL